MEQNILVLGFDAESKAYQAFSVLKQSAAQERLGLAEMIPADAIGVISLIHGLSGLSERSKHVFARAST